ncbi:NADPH:quinone oxidoreductase family protein [Pseudoruegeria sp. HB172150]|uniref:NADPH:quinone oxidoreductase family protein n=1 Tax=Pseudoruegeria sp. HB172150 TaxID=2721164 RepID=UPI00155681B4|nr:NADPH:quinone oxidoreductase family protein [Pseudoruegeria sp. HB172150]
MRVFGIEEYGQAPGFREMPVPDPGPGEVRVRIAACGLNFADLLMIEGRYQVRPEPPVILGKELAGTVEAVGAGVTSPAVGARVSVFAETGGLAEAGCFPAERCVVLPDAMEFDVAAGFQIAYGTSHLALDHRARLKPGETLLVLGAAGGVGLTAVEIGKAMGARVIACARGAERLEVVRAAGADHLIDSETEDLREAVIALGRADVVYDPVGGDQFRAALRAVKPEARMLVIGFASGDVPQIPANVVLVKNVTVIGLYWGGYTGFAPEVLTGSLETLMGWYANGRLHPHIGRKLPFDAAGEGLELLRRREVAGKLVIEM